MNEEWRTISCFERYQVSNLGRVKSYAQDKSGKILTLSADHKGYKVVSLYNDNGYRKTIKVHRLVAMAFLPNPNNLPEVNHKDEDKTNNCVDNLEWCTCEYNILYGTKIERTAMANRCCLTTSKKIYSVDFDGNIEHFDSIGDASRITGLAHNNIVRALKGRCKTCGRKKWYYEIDTNHQQRLNEKGFADYTVKYVTV